MKKSLPGMMSRSFAALAVAFAAAEPAAALPRGASDPTPAPASATATKSDASVPLPTVMTDVGMDLIGLANIQVLMPVTDQVRAGLTGTLARTQLWGTTYTGRGVGMVAEWATEPAPADPYIVKTSLTVDQVDGVNPSGGAHMSAHLVVFDLLAGHRWTFAGGNILSLAAGARFFDVRKGSYNYAVAGEGDLRLRMPVKRALLPAIEFGFGRGPE